MSDIVRRKSNRGVMEVGEAQRLRGPDEENRRFKQWLADLSLDQEVLKANREKNP